MRVPRSSDGMRVTVRTPRQDDLVDMTRAQSRHAPTSIRERLQVGGMHEARTEIKTTRWRKSEGEGGQCA